LFVHLNIALGGGRADREAGRTGQMKGIRISKRSKTQPENLKGAFFNEDGSVRLPGQTPVRNPVPPEEKPQPGSDRQPHYKKRGSERTWGQILGEDDDD